MQEVQCVAVALQVRQLELQGPQVVPEMNQPAALQGTQVLLVVEFM